MYDPYSGLQISQYCYMYKMTPIKMFVHNDNILLYYEIRFQSNHNVLW